MKKKNHAQMKVTTVPSRPGFGTGGGGGGGGGVGCSYWDTKIIVFTHKIHLQIYCKIFDSKYLKLP